MQETNNHKVVCFGEVLWDILPSGAVPGGAPMNVTYHLEKQGKNPALVTRVGNDQMGKDLTDIYAGFGVCTDFFQLDEEHETGKVYAEPNEFNEVVYDIVLPVAWDFIEYKDEYNQLVANADYFVFGSLAARNDVSKQTLLQLLEAAKKRVLDINLRAPHFNRRIVEELLQKVDFLKLNLAELELITGWFSTHQTVEDRIRSIADKFHISDMVVTMGGDGAILHTNGQVCRHNGFKVDVVDTVGSGDAFLAGLLTKFIEGASPTESLEFASGLGAFIATQKGGCPPYTIAELTTFIQSKSKQSV